MALSVKELQIGDWVVYNPNVFTEDEYEPHHKCYAKKIESGEDIDLSIEGCYEPIPLTREMLELNGFKMRSRYEYEEGDWVEKWIWNSDDLFEMFEVMHSDVDGFLWNGCDIKYIHELQRALRCCGLWELSEKFKI